MILFPNFLLMKYGFSLVHPHLVVSASWEAGNLKKESLLVLLVSFPAEVVLNKLTGCTLLLLYKYNGGQSFLVLYNSKAWLSSWCFRMYVITRFVISWRMSIIFTCD
jgi:hypothetical protein